MTDSTAKNPVGMTPEEIRETESYKAFPIDRNDLSAMHLAGDFDEKSMFDQINVEEDFAAHVWLMDNWEWFKTYVDKMIGEEVEGDGKGENKTKLILIGVPKWVSDCNFLLTKCDNPVYDFFLDIFYSLDRATDEEIEAHEESLKK